MFTQELVDIDVPNDATAIDDVCAVASFFYRCKVVGAVQNAIATLFVQLHVLVQCLCSLWVQTCQWFVQQPKCWLMNQGCHQANLLTHTMRVGRNHVKNLVAKLEDLLKLVNARLTFLLGSAMEISYKVDVLHTCHFVEHCAVIWNVAQMLFCLQWLLADVVATNFYCALVKLEKACQALDCC